ncbi:MOSC N-terminal beta barrel domain-containing protein [Rothia sp. LK2588]|uniref:MOSC N-terminal beta barrel domain-containing protein n=1 Tax=Rothia sp. LK2588 TaxID=3114369 RepID=UPI0034CD3D25
MRTLTVQSFGFTPMKGTRHAPQPPAPITAQGMVGDRFYCLVDVEKKTVLRTIGHLELMQVVCTYRPAASEAELPPLLVEIPGHPPITVDRPRELGRLTCDYWGRETTLTLLHTEANTAFSEFLGKPVTLARAEPNEVVYGGPFTLVGTATLEELGRHLDHPLLTEHARIRVTFLVDTSEPFEEERWQDDTLRLSGAGLPPTQFRAGQPIGRCAVIDANPTTGVRDVGLFKLLTATRPRNHRGEPVLGIELFLA